MKCWRRSGSSPRWATAIRTSSRAAKRQRIALARAIVHRPRILVGDEPLSALDVTVRAQILELLIDLRRTTDLTLLLVSHDIGVVQNLCDAVVVMKDGHIVERGSTQDVLLHPTEDYTKTAARGDPGDPGCSPSPLRRLSRREIRVRRQRAPKSLRRRPVGLSTRRMYTVPRSRPNL